MLNERTITQDIAFESPMELSKSILYGVDAGGSTFVLGSSSDIYALLDNNYSDIEELYGIVIQTTGWEAPLNPETGETDCPPSEHAERRRVALVVTLTLNGFCVGMKFARHVPGAVIEEATIDESLPSGLLWDAMNECMDKVKKARFN